MKRRMLVLAILCLLPALAAADWRGGPWRGPEKGKSVAFQVDPAATAATVGTGKAAFTVPAWMGGWLLTDAECRVYTPGSGSGSLDVSVSRRTAASEGLMYSATVGTGYEKWHGAASAANLAVSPGDLVTVSVTRVHGTPSKGLWVTLTFHP